MIKELLIENLFEKSKEKRERSGKFSPSSFGRCYRNQVFNQRDEPKTEKDNERSLMNFAVGNLIHHLFQDNIKAEHEVDVENDIVKGRADTIIDDCVYDYKSMNSFFFKELGQDIIEAKYPAVLQACFYAVVLQKKRFCLVIVSKKLDILSVKEYTYKTDDYMQHVNDEILELRKYWDNDKLPPAIPRAFGGKDCDYCNFRTRCQEIEEANNDRQR